jgi:uncharacterized protein HemX
VPVTGGVVVGGIPSSTGSPTATASPVKAKAAASARSSGRLAGIITFVVAAAVVLGLGGVAGLYLTRHRHEH